MLPKYSGLTSDQIKTLQQKHPPNVLPSQQKFHTLSLLVSQIKNPIIYILIIASLITFFLTDYLNSIAILIAILLNTTLGFVQEYKAQKILEKLNNLLSPKTTVIRNSNKQVIDIQHLLPGDIVLLSQGDKIPADGIVLEYVSLTINEAILTGESLPLDKKPQDQLFMGTIVTSGRGVMKVEKTGLDTEVGKIAKELKAAHETKTPLQKQTDKLAVTLSIIVIILSLLIFVTGVFWQEDLITIFATSVAIAVSAIPEGLAVTLTAILAIGMQRILKRKAIVRRLVSVETLGSVTVIATDKTGTLTEGEMKITNHDLKDRQEALKVAIVCNNLEDPIEIAIWDWTEDQEIDPQKVFDENPRISEIPFDSEYKYMAVQTKDKIYVKGAPDIVIEMCDLLSDQKQEALKLIENYGKQGLRMVALASSDIKGANLKQNLKNLKWIGLLGASDPIRASVKETLMSCQKAGIKTIVVTGDYERTAMYVMEKLGIPIRNPSEESMEGKELEVISDEDLFKRIEKIKLFSRVSPHQKLKIVKALQENGEVVAVTGDGVNDALALKQADVGIVVNSASDIAKDTADLILLDSNFSTIVASIEEGRGIFDNIKRVVLYIISDAFSEIVLIVSTILLKLPLPLTVAQILWINILADGLPSLALTLEPKSRSLMSRPPRQPSEALLTPQIKALVIIISVFSGLSTLFLYVYYLSLTNNLDLAKTVAFSFLAVNSLITVLSVRALSKPMIKVNVFKNPGLIFTIFLGIFLQILIVYNPTLSSLFKTVPLLPQDWVVILLQSFLVITAIEFTKFILSKKISTANFR